MSKFAGAVALLLVVSACSSTTEITAPDITVASTTTSTTATLAPTTTTTPPTITLWVPAEEYRNQPSDYCGYLYPAMGLYPDSVGIERLVGMDETAARTEVERCGWRLRVTRRDGADLAITADLNSKRVDAVIVNSVVVEVRYSIGP